MRFGAKPFVVVSVGWWLSVPCVTIHRTAAQAASRLTRVISADWTNGFEQDVIELYEDEQEAGDAWFSSPLRQGDYGRRLQAMNESDPNFYGVLRTIANATDEGNYLFRVPDPNSSTREFVLGHLISYLPFTVDGTNPGPGMQADAFAALLAVYHFNNPEVSPILDSAVVRSLCPDLRFTMGLSDSQLYPIETTRLFIQQLKSTKSLSRPPATGVLGAYRSSVSLPLAILTGVNHIPQVSPASTANDFDEKEQFPLFGRTVWNAMDEARVAVEFFSSINSTHVVVLYLTVRGISPAPRPNFSRSSPGLTPSVQNFLRSGYVRVVTAKGLSGCGEQGQHLDGAGCHVVQHPTRRRRGTRGDQPGQGEQIPARVRHLLRAAAALLDERGEPPGPGGR